MAIFSLLDKGGTAKKNATEKLAKRAREPLEVAAGKCPHCHQYFQNPVVLPCGHSLCKHCCDELLCRHRFAHCSTFNDAPTPIGDPMTTSVTSLGSLNRRPRVRMGVSMMNRTTSSSVLMKRSGSRASVQTTASRLMWTPSNTIKEAESPPRVMSPGSESMLSSGYSSTGRGYLQQHILSPECPVCGCEASKVRPILNLALAQLIRFLRNDAGPEPEEYGILKEVDFDKPTSPTPSSSSSGFEETEESHDPPPTKCFLQSESEEEACIRRCNIALFGGPKVGKSQLMRTQFLNSMFFGHIDESPKSTSAKPSSRRGSSEVHAKFMLSIIDNNNVKDDLKEAHGVILVYAVDDRQSVETVKSIFQEIRLRRRDNPPMILVANKADLPGTQRQFSTFEGEQLAMAFECPFLEVSSRRNEGVNEAFTRLVHMVDRQQTPALAAATTTHL